MRQTSKQVYRIERSVDVDNFPESDGSESECAQDSNRESSGKFIAINSSILARLKHGSAACLLASAPLNSTIFRCHCYPTILSKQTAFMESLY